MQVYIHIGYPKTATRWFQEVYFPNIKNAIAVNRNEVYNNIIAPESFIYNPKKVTEKYKHFTNKIIISNHGFVGTNHNFGLRGYLTKEHANRLKQVFPDAVIVLFIRSQLEIIASAYIQYIKCGGNYGISKYIFHKRFQKLNDIAMFSFSHFEYHYIIELYEELFGKRNVYVFLYEEYIANRKQFVKQFSEQLEFDLDVNSLNFNEINTGYRKYVCKSAKLLNCFTEKNIVNKYYLFHIPAFYEYSRFFLDFLNQFSLFGKHLDAKKIFRKKLYEHICEYYKKSNSILIHKHKLYKIRNFGYPL